MVIIRPYNVQKNKLLGEVKMKKNRSVLYLAALAALPFGSVAQAQSSATPTYELSGTSISGSAGAMPPILTAPVGAGLPLKFENGLHIHPTLSTSYGYNDNLMSDRTNSLKSNFVSFTPQLVGEFRSKGNRYTALASMNSRRYSESSGDNTDESQLVLAGDHYFDARARGAWALGRTSGTDSRGSNNRPVTAEAARWHSNNIDGRFIYGAPEAAGRVEFDIGNKDKLYDNERATTAVGDVRTGSYAGRLFYRLGTKTLAVAEFRDSKANYSSALAAGESNRERYYYLGLTWEATAATTGIVKVGHLTKDFDVAGKQGFSGTSWDATVQWTPLTYSTIDLLSSRKTADATGFGVYNLVTSTSLNWAHKWNQRLGSSLSLGVMNTEFGGTTRADSALNYGFGVNYEILRWLKFGLDFSVTDNGSNSATNEYKRNTTMLKLDATL
jgi:hypothetical protein